MIEVLTGRIGLGIVAGIYAVVAYTYWRTGRRGMALAFAAYALANFGFIADLGRKP